VTAQKYTAAIGRCQPPDPHILFLQTEPT
jgi:hypothetical protein